MLLSDAGAMLGGFAFPGWVGFGPNLHGPQPAPLVDRAVEAQPPAVPLLAHPQGLIGQNELPEMPDELRGTGAGAMGIPPYGTTAAGLPILDSLPGAAAAIFLDFDGDSPSNTQPYDEDGNPTTFNATEQANIAECWRQMSVYYAMFDANVTTVQPDTSVTPTAWEGVGNNISGGWSWVNVFPNRTQAQSFNNSGDARGRVSGIAHEIGHNFGLGHQSTYDLFGNKTQEYAGETDPLHGPMMGVDFAGMVHKWIIGHPSSSPSSLQDDMALIANKIKAYEPSGGDGYRADDFGETIAAATPLPVEGVAQSIAGIIERLTDADVFSFTTGGERFTIGALPDAPSGVDLKLSVLRGDGTLLAEQDADTNPQRIALTLSAGTYYALVRGHGNYGDVGQYVLRVDSLPAGWSSTDVGFVCGGGYGEYDPATGTYLVAGSGADVWGTSDTLHFAYRAIAGDTTVVARVAAIGDTDAWAKAGVDIRESLADNARHAAMIVSARNGPQMVWRYSTGGSSAGYYQSAVPFAPTWVKLVRSGDSFTGYRSSDGTNWTYWSAATVPMSSTVYVGLVASAHNQAKINVGQFQSVAIAGNPVVPPNPTINALPAPTGLAVVGTTASSVSLQWNSVGGATGYTIERSADGADYAQAGSVPAGATSFVDGNLAGYRRYFYRVRAADAAGVSPASAVVHGLTRPGPVANLAVTSWTSTQLILNWRDSSGETGYRIERSPDGLSNWVSVGSTGKNIPSFTNSGLAIETYYYYRLVTLDALGDAAVSAAAPGVTRLPAVTGLSFVSKSPTQMAIRWNDSASETSYRVERSTDGTTYATTATLAANVIAYTDANVVPLGEYYYRVIAVGTVTESVAPTPLFAAAPAAAALPAPWQSQDVGTVAGSGAAGSAGGTFTLVSNGSDIWGTADQFRYVYQPLEGDGWIVARVATLENTDGWAKLGVMIRESLNANASYAFAAVTPGNGIAFQYRTATGASAVDGPRYSGNAPYWVRLTRSGSTFTGAVSSNGSSWTDFASVAIGMGSAVYVGLAGTSHNATSLNTSTFDGVSLSNYAPTVLTAAAASPNPTTGTTTALSVKGADDHGEAYLKYTWSAISLPAGAPLPTFSSNGSGAAKNTVATFGKAGSYVFRVSIADLDGLICTSSIGVTVSQKLTNIAVSPGAAVLAGGGVQQFVATAYDQFVAPLLSQPAFVWTATVGTIGASGLYTALNADASGTVRAAAGGTSGTATVTIVTLPHVVSWKSAQNHARGVGEAALTIPDDGKFSEPRDGGIRRLLVTFDEPVAPASFTLASVRLAGNDAGGSPVDLTGIAVSTTLRSGNTVGVVEFSRALPDLARYLVRLQGVTDAAGNPLAGDNDRILTALKGDVTGDLRVNVTDLSWLQARYVDLILATNEAQVRADLNTDGRINVTDFSRCWAQRNRDARNIPDPVVALGGSSMAAVQQRQLAAYAALQSQSARRRAPLQATLLSAGAADRVFELWTDN